MTSQPIQHKQCEDAVNQTQGELLELLLQPEEFYLWNPADPETEAYFVEQDGEFLPALDSEAVEVVRASQVLFNQLHQCWALPAPSVSDTLLASLSQRFAAAVPPVWLEAIATKARQVFSTNLSLADQLVQCVTPVLPNWSQEDLFVLARPWAYAMRGTPELVGSDLLSIARSGEWRSLTQVEQVRLSLEIAHTALRQLKDAAGGTEPSANA